MVEVRPFYCLWLDTPYLHTVEEDIPSTAYRYTEPVSLTKGSFLGASGLGLNCWLLLDTYWVSYGRGNHTF